MPNKKIVTYITSFKQGNRFAIPGGDITSDYTIINLDKSKISGKAYTIDDFNNFLTRIRKNYQVLVIYSDFTTIFVDILFHVLSQIETYKIPIHIDCKIFSSLELILNIQSEYVSYVTNGSNKDAFPIRDYKFISESVDYSSPVPRIIFADPFKEVKMENGLKFFINSSSGSRIDQIDTSNFYFFDFPFEEEYETVLKNTNATPVQFNDENNVILCDYDYIDFFINPNTCVVDDTIFVNGLLEHSDFWSRNVTSCRVYEQKEHLVQKLFQNEKYILIGENDFLFPKAKFRIKIEKGLTFKIYKIN